MALIHDGGRADRRWRAPTVTFRELDAALIDWYLASRGVAGRAGAYAVQGRGAALVASIDGDYWNVVGLPVPLLLDMAPWLSAADPLISLQRHASASGT